MLIVVCKVRHPRDPACYRDGDLSLEAGLFSSPKARFGHTNL